MKTKHRSGFGLDQRGFTLIETLISVIIVALLSFGLTCVRCRAWTFPMSLDVVTTKTATFQQLPLRHVSLRHSRMLNARLVRNRLLEHTRLQKP